MKSTKIMLVATTGLLLLAGCAITPVALDPIGPALTRQKSPASDPTGEGWLRVYTATDTVPDGKTAYYYPHTGYEIYTKDGKLLEHVPNRISDMDESATLLKIQAGHYRVMAQSEAYNAVSVPVTIQPGEITEVHLGCHWKAPATASTNEIVYFPDGRPVGWKSPLTE